MEHSAEENSQARSNIVQKKIRRLEYADIMKELSLGSKVYSSKKPSKMAYQ